MNRKTAVTVSSLPLAALVMLGLAATGAPQSDAKAPVSSKSGLAEAAVYKIDDVHSSALFRVHHLGAGQFWGRFNGVSGTMGFGDGGVPTAFDVAIATESVDTAAPNLDAHLKTPDFFNVKEFPSMTFKSASVTRKSDGSYEVTGDLTMHGVTKSVTAALEVTGIADMGMGARAGVEAVFTVKRSEFGMKYGLEKGTLGDSVRVVVGLEGTRN